MTWFVLITVVMTAGALGWVLPPLLRRRAAGGVVRPESNLALLRDQLAELDTDLRNGVIAAEQHARARAELERRILEEVVAEPQPAVAAKGAPRWTAVAVGVSVPLVAGLLYGLIGSPDALAPRAPVHGGPTVTPEQVEQMVSRLAAKLEANPGDANGWALLGRSLLVMGRFGEAAKAYGKAVELVKDDADLYADYADALAMAQGRRIEGEALKLVEQALKLDPDHVKALALAATAAIVRKDRKSAEAYLSRLRAQVPADSEMGRQVAGMLAEAQGSAPSEARPPAPTGKAAAPGVKPAAPGMVARIEGRVALSPALAAKAAPTDTVFILARSPEGPRMPIAILRRQVKDLPVEFSLGDDQAMSPEMRLSKFREVVVVARVSKGGGATPQSGDLQGASGAVKVGATGINVVIDTIVP